MASRGESAEKMRIIVPASSKAPAKIKLLGNGISKIKVKKDKTGGEEGADGTEGAEKIKKRKILTMSSKDGINGAAPIKTITGKIMIRKSDIKIKKEQ